MNFIDRKLITIIISTVIERTCGSYITSIIGVLSGLATIIGACTPILHPPYNQDLTIVGGIISTIALTLAKDKEKNV